MLKAIFSPCILDSFFILRVWKRATRSSTPTLSIWGDLNTISDGDNSNFKILKIDLYQRYEKPKKNIDFKKK
jgi:hypothetical protein